MTKAIDLFSAFSTDAQKESEGIETTLPGCGDTKFRVARAGNKNYNRTLAALYKKHRVTLESKGDEAEAKSNELLADVYAETLLLGWSGTIQFQGKAEPYSKDTAKKLLALKEFRAVVDQVAQDFQSFKTVQDEEDLGN